METLVQIGSVGLDAIHLVVIALLLLAGGVCFWLHGERTKVNEALEREQDDLSDTAMELQSTREKLEANRLDVEAARVELAQLRGQTDKQREDFNTLAQQVMKQAQAQFVEMADETFKKHREGAKGELKELMQPIGENFDAFK